LDVQEFDYELPPDRIAQRPLEDRLASRLMVVDRSADAIYHRMFTDLIDYIDTGDVLVLNDTRVMPDCWEPRSPREPGSNCFC
jgi:S-adenosylmethionine:tRNA ribosyltransferase-isomerase